MNTTTLAATLLTTVSTTLAQGPACDFVPGYQGGVQFGDISQGQGGVSEWRAIRHSMGEEWGTACNFAPANSANMSARMSWSGSIDTSVNALTLSTTGLPSGVPGYYLCSQGFQVATPVVASQGLLCLGGAIGRLDGPSQVLHANLVGAVTLPLDLTQLPQPHGLVTAMSGERWLFQFWYRDANPGPTSNLSDALHVLLR